MLAGVFLGQKGRSVVFSIGTRRIGVALVLAALALAAILMGVSCAWRKWALNFGVVVPGVLMRSAQPSAADYEHIMRTYGLKTIVNFRSPRHMATEPECIAEREFAQSHGVKSINLPISTPPTEEQIVQFMRILDAPENHPVLIHCAAGQGRASMMCAVYGMERLGWSNEKALAMQVPYKFERCRKGKEEMREFILRYRPSHPVPVEARGCPPAATPRRDRPPSRTAQPLEAR